MLNKILNNYVKFTENNKNLFSTKPIFNVFSNTRIVLCDWEINVQYRETGSLAL